MGYTNSVPPLPIGQLLKPLQDKDHLGWLPVETFRIKSEVYIMKAVDLQIVAGSVQRRAIQHPCGLTGQMFPAVSLRIRMVHFRV